MVDDLILLSLRQVTAVEDLFFVWQELAVCVFGFIESGMDVLGWNRFGGHLQVPWMISE